MPVRTTTRLYATLAIVGMLSGGCQSDSSSTRQSLTVFSAASLTQVVDALCANFTTETGVTVRTSYASSATLARQILAGAPADLYVSANPQWMNALEERGLLAPGTRRILARNRLAIVAPSRSRRVVKLTREGDPNLALPGKVALGDPDHVPAGMYAKEALRTLGWWSTVAPRIVAAMDVRAALALVETAEVDSGIVYVSDAAQSGSVVTLVEIPETLHSPIEYPVALLNHHHPAAKPLLDLLVSDQARRALRSAGFSVAP